MDIMLHGIRGVCLYLDDILVSGATDFEHRQRLDRVLEILSSRGLRLCKDKCSFGNHFDPSKEIVLSCDASYGAVIANVMSDGTEQPIAYYSQLDKEALAIICAVKRFLNHRS